jgi:hypothetical protein
LEVEPMMREYTYLQKEERRNVISTKCTWTANEERNNTSAYSAELVKMDPEKLKVPIQKRKVT